MYDPGSPEVPPRGPAHLDAPADSPLAPQLRSANAISADLREFAALRFTGESDSGTVTATVDGEGTVREVYISPHAIRDLRAEDLGPACTTAVAAARITMSDGLARRIEELRVTHTAGADAAGEPDPRRVVGDLHAKLRNLL